VLAVLAVLALLAVLLRQNLDFGIPKFRGWCCGKLVNPLWTYFRNLLDYSL
jgi:hypothetical protein